MRKRRGLKTGVLKLRLLRMRSDFRSGRATSAPPELIVAAQTAVCKMESQEARVLDAFMMNARTLSSVLKAIQFRDVSKNNN